MQYGEGLCCYRDRREFVMYKTVCHTSSLVISLLNAGILGSCRPFQIL